MSKARPCIGLHGHANTSGIKQGTKDDVPEAGEGLHDRAWHCTAVQYPASSPGSSFSCCLVPGNPHAIARPFLPLPEMYTKSQLTLARFLLLCVEMVESDDSRALESSPCGFLHKPIALSLSLVFLRRKMK
ncbi:hypothetical protein L1987_48410 [Smallanthus sonchifolius]|uniref:Uncharacterized protein n=1 Tax=Smallanthus sonchifolius TaxID=185202 RepID=A0ACB9FSC4_9ASTR|nr:hypothetical protein L1987_48410 [Smallanthus sonchifolius]